LIFLKLKKDFFGTKNRKKREKIKDKRDEILFSLATNTRIKKNKFILA